jgi:hypothetical protein
MKMIGAGSLATALPAGILWSRPVAAADYQGPILAVFQANGGFDASWFVDPKEDGNVNSWARSMPAGRAGNIRYAPVGNNQAFFEKHYQKMLVINGIDIQTGSHGAGRVNRSSGRLGNGFPQISELFASANGATMPLAYIDASNGYGADNVGLIARGGTPDLGTLQTLIDPNYRGNQASYFKTADLDLIQQAQKQRLDAMLVSESSLPRWRKKINELHAAANSDNLGALGDAILNGGGLDRQTSDGTNDSQATSIHLFLLSALSGLSVVGNFGSGGFDTHTDHDVKQTRALDTLLRRIDYLWDKATELGIADRLVVHITSDVGRRPFYNARNGKDHYTASSAVMMATAQPWPTRGVGASGVAHEKLQINPASMQVDPNGLRIQPQHVQNELRFMLGIDQHKNARDYILTDQRFNVFEPGVQTGFIV